VVIQASIPDQNGQVSFSLSNGAHLEERRGARADPDRLLILECSPHFPRARAFEGHADTLRLDEVDVVVVSVATPTVLASEGGAPEDFAVAEYAATYIRVGSTRQTGIGAILKRMAQRS
jgi:hypothetical protein